MAQIEHAFDEVQRTTIMKDIPARWRSFGRYESLLGVVLLMEILIFAWTGKRFASRDNLFEVLRVSVEMGLLALVITPVILTGDRKSVV